MFPILHLILVDCLRSRDKDWRSDDGIETNRAVSEARSDKTLPLQLAKMSLGDGGITSQSQKQSSADGPRGLGDFQRRSNRAARDYRRNDTRGAQNDDQQRRGAPSRGWEDATPRETPRTGREDAPSVRVPNVAWDATPRNQVAGSGSGWGAARDRRWDAPTPRNVRGGDDDDAASVVGGREWEEEQVKLDRDWYMGSEGGVVSPTLNNDGPSMILF